MKAELQEALYKKYPELFYQKNMDMTQTCMCWGIDTGDGWYKLLDQLCKAIIKYCNKTQTTIPQFTQVKEKYGTLRVYTSFYDENIEDLIYKAEDKSSKICEDCGQKGKVNEGGWLRVTCGKCHDY